MALNIFKKHTQNNKNNTSNVVSEFLSLNSTEEDIAEIFTDGNGLELKKGMPNFAPIPDNIEEQNLFQKYFVSKIYDESGNLKSSNQKLRKEIAEKNAKLVTFVVNSFFSQKNYYSLKEDLLQEGHIGLFEAIDKFDPTLGYKFSTYAVHWIHQSCSSYLMFKNQFIYIPAHIKTAKNKLTKFLKENDKVITDITKDDLKKLDMTEKMFESIKAASKIKESSIVSINSPISSSTRTTLEEYGMSLEDSAFEKSESFMPEKQKIKTAVLNSFKKLTTREKMIFLLRFDVDIDEVNDEIFND